MPVPRQRIERVCPVCGNVFELRFCELADRKHCSKACHIQAQRVNMWKTVVCASCGKTFETRTNKIAKSGKSYCCRECAVDALRKPKISVECLTCGKKMERSPCYVQERNFCSKRCRGLQVPSGPANPNWKGQRRDNRAVSQAWARAVKMRAGNKCQQCGSTKRIAAHHIFPFAQYPELRYERSNGVCLCRKCHMAVHHAKQSDSSRGSE